MRLEENFKPACITPTCDCIESKSCCGGGVDVVVNDSKEILIVSSIIVLFCNIVKCGCYIFALAMVRRSSRL